MKITSISKLENFLRKLGSHLSEKLKIMSEKNSLKVALKESQSIEISMNLSSEDGKLSHLIKDKIAIK